MDPYRAPDSSTPASSGARVAPTGAARFAVLGLGLCAVGAVFSALGALVSLATGPSDAVDIVVGLVALGGLAVFLGTAVAFLVWLSKASKLVHALNADGAGGPTISSGWAVGWWFVPFANLVKPLNVVQELWAWSESDPADRPGPHGAALSSWWGLWIASNIANNFSARMALKPDMLTVATVLDLLAQLLTIGAAVLAIQVVRGLQARLEAAVAA